MIDAAEDRSNQYFDELSFFKINVEKEKQKKTKKKNKSEHDYYSKRQSKF